MVSPDPADGVEVRKATERVTVRHERTVNVGCYGGGTLYIGIQRPGTTKASAVARLSTRDADRVIAALTAARDAAAANIDAYHARKSAA